MLKNHFVESKIQLNLDREGDEEKSLFFLAFLRLGVKFKILSKKENEK
jgi:hypothetical protein